MSEIIINDVDVSGCEYLTPVLHNCKIKTVYDKCYYPCGCNINCHYKQLKREREINERLEEGCKVWQQTLERNHYMKDNEVVRLEREKQQLLDECVNEKEKTHNLYLISQKYKAALEEIKDIAEPIYEQMPHDKVLRQILLKINEV